MRSLSMDEVKQVELNILTYIDKICRENNIQYYLFFGTLLGAVRHKGFIPWDDDIDIAVPISQYNRLLELLTDNDKRYKVFSFDTHADYPYFFAKCAAADTQIVEKNVPPVKGLGIYIDIFPLLYCPDGKIRRKLFMKTVSFLRNIGWHGAMKEFGGAAPTTLKNKVMQSVSIFCPWRRALSCMLRIGARKKNSSSCLILSRNLRCCDYDLLGVPVNVAFENQDFYAPHEYDRVLRIIYGDYLKLPPEEKRVLRHDFEAYSIV